MNDKAQLQEKWEEFRKTKIPPELEELDIKSDFALLDGHIAGLVTSYLGNNAVDKKLIYIDKEVDKKLLSFIPRTVHDRKYHPAYIKYKQMIDEITRLLANCLSVKLS